MHDLDVDVVGRERAKGDEGPHGQDVADLGSVADTLVGTTTESLAPAEEYDGGRLRFDGTVTLDHSGGFGYTVRIIPKNALLASTAELGVVALP